MADLIESGEARFWNEQPDVPTGLEWLIEAFWTLSHFRPVGVGMAVVYGSLPYEALRDDAMVRGLRGDAFLHYRECMIAMDRTYLRIVNQPKKPITAAKE